MKICDFCGNELALDVVVCPYCEQPIHKKSVAVSKKKYTTLLIKKDLPTCEEAIKLLEQAVFGARAGDIKVIKIIHGYGSTGVGGELRYCLRDYLDRMIRLRMVNFIVPGEEFSRQFKNGQKFLQMFPKFENDKDLNRFNKGITFVVL
jgi:hypothetical protein